MEQETKLWLDKSYKDYGVAEYLLNNYYPMPIEIVCYHCQQAAEKAIKAIITSQGTPGGMPRLHDLSFLLNQIKNSVTIEEKYFDYADTLTPYGIAVRYPNELFLEERHAKDAVKYAKEIVEFAENIITKEF